jgi:hypothetical protein
MNTKDKQIIDLTIMVTDYTKKIIAKGYENKDFSNLLQGITQVIYGTLPTEEQINDMNEKDYFDDVMKYEEEIRNSAEEK